MKDHRDFWRVSSNCAVAWRKVGDGPDLAGLADRRGVMHNISGGGVSFTAETDPGQGTMIAMSLDLPGLPTSVLSLGRTVWTKPANGGFDVGVEFWWIGWKDEDAQAKIRSFIAEKLREGAPAP